MDGEVATAEGRAPLGPYDIGQIMEVIPHRFPFLLVDRILELVKDEHVVGLKNVTANEAHFLSPSTMGQVMPGSLIVEAMAQCAAVMVLESMGPQAAGKLLFFTGIDRVRFLHPVRPGNRLIMRLRKDRRRGAFWRIAGDCQVDGRVVATALCSASVMNR